MNRSDRFRNDVRVNQWKNQPNQSYDNSSFSRNDTNYGEDEYLDNEPRRLSSGRRPSYKNNFEENDWRRSAGRNESSQDYNRYNGAQNDFGESSERERYHASSDVYPQRSSSPYTNFTNSNVSSNRSSRNYSGVGPKGYKRSDDRIEEEVCNVLLKDKNINASDIEVKVKNGIVTLSGTVENRSDKLEAEMAIEGIAGVEDINNEIKLKKWGDYSDRPYLRNSEERYAQNKYPADKDRFS